MNIEKILEKTNVLADACALGVDCMKDVKEEIENGAPIEFNANLWHIPKKKHKRTCMCVAGTIAHKYGIPLDQYWYPIYTDEELERMVLCRMSFLSGLRVNITWKKEFLDGWRYLSNRFDEISTVIKENNEMTCWLFARDIDGHIELYETYAKKFKELGV